MAVTTYTSVAARVVLWTLAFSTPSIDAQETIHARCDFEATGTNRVFGSIAFVDSTLLGLYLEVTITEASPGFHGVHVHEYGDLSDREAGTKTGPHYNPYQEEHGCFPGPRKVGDMGNVEVNSRGVGEYIEVGNQLMRLRGESSVLGRSAIFHALEDNCERTPQGDVSAGPRHAQCLIGIVAPNDILERRALNALTKARNVHNTRNITTQL
eukprot:m.71602 g.71602  ORF g.71602 m.71602 type:complete len:211 (-) comp24368_c0_seq1:48-680(-)